jgi:hypothetical protein
MIFLSAGRLLYRAVIWAGGIEIAPLMRSDRKAGSGRTSSSIAAPLLTSASVSDTLMRGIAATAARSSAGGTGAPGVAGPTLDTCWDMQPARIAVQVKIEINTIILLMRNSYGYSLH